MTRRIVIVGGGVHGAALAFWLTRQDRHAVEVTVLERDPSYREASSALSLSSVRQQFSQPVNIQIGLFGARFLRTLGQVLAVGDERPEMPFHERGYLYLATESGRAALEENHAIQTAHGARVVLLDPAELRRRWPWLSTEGIALASFGEANEGWFDGYLLLRAFRRKAIAQGARFVTAEATAAVHAGGRVDAVVTESGERLPCDVHVTAAGPWSARVTAQLGVELPVRARHRTVTVFECPEPLPGFPLVIDPTGAYVRPEGKGYVAGTSPGPGEPDPDDRPLNPDPEIFETRVWPAIAHRVPAFERLRVTAAWAGWYDYNTVDQNGLVGRLPGFENAYVTTGFSGHGIQQAPAVGCGLAELILDGRYRTIDLGPLDPIRIVQGRPLLERNVI